MKNDDVTLYKTLVIVESPKKAKSIGKYLGSDYIVIASYGHCFDLISSSRFPLGVNLKNFEPKYSILENKMKVVRQIIESSTEATQIYLASDPDREGESISCHLAKALESTGKPMFRIIFTEITEKAVKKAIKNPISLNWNLNSSQQARRVIDRLVGFQVSSFLKKNQDGESAGRVQSVALKMLVDLEKEVTSFVPKKYWTVSAKVVKDDSKEPIFIKYHKNLDSAEEAATIVSILKKEPLIVSSLKKDKKSQPPKPPFTTLTMIASAHSALKLSASETMTLAQSLYEDGLITYMRTDSTRLSEDSIKEARNYLTSKNLDVPKNPNKYQANVEAQDAHEAVRPTDSSLEPKDAFATPQAQKLYDLIWKRFLASQMKPAVYNTVNAELLTKSKHLFKASGKSLEYSGHLAMINDGSEDAGGLLPPLEVGEIFMSEDGKATEKQTQPPSRYNERTLVEDLEKKGVGRPSTYHTILGKLTDRSYAEIKPNGIIIPTLAGIKVVKRLADYFTFMKYDYTAEMETKLDQIADGKLSYLEMMKDFYSAFSEELRFAHAKINNSEEICPLCSSICSEFVKNEVTYVHCYKYPDCPHKVRRDSAGGVIALAENSETFCPRCNFFTHQIVYGKNGESFTSCLRYPNCR